MFPFRLGIDKPANFFHKYPLNVNPDARKQASPSIVMRIFLLQIVSLCLLLTGCGERPPVALKPLKKPSERATATIKPEVLVALGARLYQHNCVSCHLADGSGIAGQHPSLVASPLIRGDNADLIRSLLYGSDFLAVHPRARRETPGDVMPPHDHFTDLEIAAIATYLRTSFNNAGPVIQPPEVAPLRENQAAVFP